MKRKIYTPSSRSNISPFLVMNLLQKAKGMETNKKKVFHLELGEPQMKTPKLIINEAKKIITKKIPGYTPSNGISELRDKISMFYKKKYKLNIPKERIFVTTGSSGSFLLSFLLNFDQGKNVAIFNPVYPAYRNILKSLNINVIEIYPKENNNIDCTLIEKEKNLDGLIISNPNNPNGQVFSNKELDYIYNYCEKKKIRLIADEIYHGVTYDCSPNSILNFGTEAIVINSFSKYFCMPGWRLGWIIVPELQVENLLKLSQNIFISSGNIAQFLAVKAFDCIKDLDKIVEGYRYNRDQSLKILNKMPLLNFSIPQGAFYFYINIEKLNIDSFSLVDRLLMETGVALTPGVDFDKLNGKKTIRISFSSETKNVLNGMKIFRKWYQKYY